MRIFLFFFVLTITSINAQVGIGTTSPDESSLLDMTSTTQGVLTPRMTSVQRVGIATPAQGLLVYDTDEQSFYYFDITWQKLSANNKRNNYKLVQDISDLSEELIAGGGAIYELNTDFLYEINGTILFDFPIDLNGAYVEGVDSGEDVIFNNSSSGSFFQGSAGGSIRNLTIAANGRQVFDISGSGTELLVVNNSIFSGASSLGDIDGVGTAFFSIIQYVNNANGFNLSNMSSLLMSNLFWTGSNSGTFATITGTFDNFQLGSGRIEADAGETGIDVSGNPIIVNEASMNGISFVGDGDFVSGYSPAIYTGFNFSTNWSVECSGIPTETDGEATGDINFNFTAGSGTPTNFASSGTPIKLAGATSSDNLFRFSRDGDNRVVYEGEKNRFFNIAASISFQGNSSGDRYIFYVARGAAGDPTPTVINQTRVWRQIGGAFDIGAVPLVGVVELTPGDYIEVWVERFSGSGGLFTVSLNLSIR